MKRRPLVEPVETWRAHRDGRGQWVVVTQSGDQPLLSQDPLCRMEAVHLAASAPEIRDALQRLAARAESVFRTYCYQHKHDMKLVFAAIGVLADSKPPWEEVARVAQQRGHGGTVQLEVDYSAHDAEREAA